MPCWRPIRRYSKLYASLNSSSKFEFHHNLFADNLDIFDIMTQHQRWCCYSFLGPTCWRWCVPLLNWVHEFSSCLLEDWQKQRRKKCFSNPVWTVFCPLYPPSLLPKSSGFLDWLGVFIMLNSFLLYLVSKVG